VDFSPDVPRIIGAEGATVGSLPCLPCPVATLCDSLPWLPKTPLENPPAKAAVAALTPAAASPAPSPLVMVSRFRLSTLPPAAATDPRHPSKMRYGLRPIRLFPARGTVYSMMGSTIRWSVFFSTRIFRQGGVQMWKCRSTPADSPPQGGFKPYCPMLKYASIHVCASEDWSITV